MSTGYSKPIGYQLRIIFNRLEEMHKVKEVATELSTGFEHLDFLTGGLKKGCLYFLCATPGAGKTSLSLSLSRNLIDEGKGVLYCHLLEDAEGMAFRLISMESLIPFRRLRAGMLRDNDWPKATRAAGRLAEAPLALLDSIPTLENIETEFLSVAGEHKPEFIVVDNLQILAKRLGVGTAGHSDLARKLSEIASRLDVALLTCIELPASADLRRSKLPLQFDLIEIALTERDADFVWYLSRPGSFEGEDSNSPELSFLEVAKNGPLPSGIVSLGFDPRTLAFCDTTDLPSQKPPLLPKESVQTLRSLNDGDDPALLEMLEREARLELRRERLTVFYEQIEKYENGEIDIDEVEWSLGREE